MNFLTLVSGDSRKSPETGRQVLDNSTTVLSLASSHAQQERIQKATSVVSCPTGSGKNTVC